MADGKASRGGSETVGRLLSITPEVRIAAAEKIVVTTFIAAQVPTVELDVDKLKEAILPLVQNALEAMPGGDKLASSLREEQLDLPRANELGIPPSKFVSCQLANRDVYTVRVLLSPD